ncbi:MAG: PD40 domain-containing protein [Bacteroidetes bacterium]|nr:PD40 domain-containing protein [Bacteroidota bacterium]MBS1973058.1 PD40 domain-containing protein [Bacteroidota bacterium]
MKKMIAGLLIFGGTMLLLMSFRKVIHLAVPAIAGGFDTLQYPQEKHFRNIRQLTFGGDNAEAYFSYDGKWLIFQHKEEKDGVMCDQMYIGKIPTSPDEKFEPKMISSGKGRTTCGFFTKDGRHVIYASTYLGGDSCPPVPDRQKLKKYIWPVYDSYDIFMADLNGKIIKRLTSTKGYDAEATLSPDGNKMIFTSMRDGDLDLYVMDLRSYKVKRITHTLGYDGGAWFSPDGKKIVWRASRPKTPEEIADYKNLLKQNLVAPTQMEVFVANADGSDARQITSYGQANWAPNFLPDGKHIIFCSNHEYKRGFPFNMYVTDITGKGLEKVSHDNGFDAFPMFSPDGKKIVFSSNRENGGGRDINIFIADWVN